MFDTSDLDYDPFSPLPLSLKRNKKKIHTITFLQEKALSTL